MLFEQGVLVQREDGVKPTEEARHGVLDTRRVLELEWDVHEGVVHAVKDPCHRCDESIVPLLVIGADARGPPRLYENPAPVRRMNVMA